MGIVQVQLPNYVLDEGFAIVRIVNGEIGGIPQQVSMTTKDSGKNRVKRPHPEGFGSRPNQGLDAFPHFPGRLVGKREGQDLKRVFALFNQMRYAVGQNPCFAGSGACNDHHRTLAAFHRSPLGRVQVIQPIHGTNLVQRRPIPPKRTQGFQAHQECSSARGKNKIR